MTDTTQQFRIDLATLAQTTLTDKYSKAQMLDEARNEEEHAAMVEQRDEDFSHLEGATKNEIRQILLDRSWGLEPSDLEDDETPDPENAGPQVIDTFEAHGMVVYLRKQPEGFTYTIANDTDDLITEARKPHDDLDHARKRAILKARKYGTVKKAA